MKNLKLSLILSGLIILSSNNTLANGEILTGDPRLACEAILCLSSGKRPDECTPSIRRYFSITDKKLHRLIRKRLNFLNLCPKDNKGIDKDVLARIGLDQEKQKRGMDSLTNVIIHLPHECTSKSLNAQIQRRVERSCDGGKNCDYSYYYRISPKMPQSCIDLKNHEWTRIELPIQYGNNNWVEGSQYSHPPLPPIWFLKDDLEKFKSKQMPR